MEKFQKDFLENFISQQMTDLGSIIDTLIKSYYDILLTDKATFKV